MSKKAKRYLLLLAAVLVAAVFFGYHFVVEKQRFLALAEEKAGALAELDKVEADNAAKQEELSQVDTPEWIRRKAHEIGLVGPDEIKIADGSK